MCRRVGAKRMRMLLIDFGDAELQSAAVTIAPQVRTGQKIAGKGVSGVRTWSCMGLGKAFSLGLVALL
jgi:hypothetical protein